MKQNSELQKVLVAQTLKNFFINEVLSQHCKDVINLIKMTKFDLKI